MAKLSRGAAETMLGSDHSANPIIDRGASLHEGKTVRGFVSLDIVRAKTGKKEHYECGENLLTEDGRDWLHTQAYTNTAASSAEAGARYIGLSANTTTPAAADTTLAGEIDSGGLARAVGTASHTDDSAVTTIAKTFTATADHTAVHKSGLFNAASSGVLVHARAFSSDFTLSSGDSVTVTWTITLG